MKKSLLLIAGLVSLAPNLGLPIGRSGNGRMASLEDGFSTSMPKQLPEFKTALDGSMRFENVSIRDSFGSTPKVVIHRFAIANPSRANMNREDLKLELLNNDWQLRSFASDGCVDLYVRDKGSVLALIAVWGGAKGFEVIGGRDGFTARAIDEIVADLILEPGACAWK